MDEIWWNCMNLLWCGKAVPILHPSYLTSHPTLHLCLLYTTEKNSNTTTDYESNYNHIVVQYNNRLWIQPQYTTVKYNYSKVIPQARITKKKQPTPPKKTSSRWWFQKFVIFIPTKYLGKCLDSIWLYNIFSDGWFNHQQVIIYRVFFPQKSVPSGRSWLPKPMPGSARASCAAVRATRLGSWMPCNDASEEHGVWARHGHRFFWGVVKLNGIQIWGDPKLGVDQTYCNANLWGFLRDFPYCD